MEYLQQAFTCLIQLISYLIPCLIILIPVRFFTPVPSFVFRKLLHIIAFSCVTFMIIDSDSWQASALASLILAAAAYPALCLAEKYPWYAKLFVQKSEGEIKRSLLMLFTMFAVLISVSWGIFKEAELAAASVLMWGTGDAAAALIGIPFGKHRIRIFHTISKKSYEGSAAMFLTSLISGLLILPRTASVFPVILTAALMGTITELLSPSEYDTVTVPAVILAVLLLFMP